MSGNVTYYVEKGDATARCSMPPRWGPRRSPTPPPRCPTRTRTPSPWPAPTTSGPTTRVMTTTSATRALVTPRSSSWARTARRSTTQVKNNADNSDITNGSSVAIGTVAYDTASLTGGTDDVSGNVTYYVEKGDATCSVLDATSLGTKTITNTPPRCPTRTRSPSPWPAPTTSGPTTRATTTTTATRALVTPRSSSWTRTARTITTQVKNNADDSDITNGSSVAIGTVAYDTASLTGGTDDVSGDRDLLRREG